MHVDRNGAYHDGIVNNRSFKGTGHTAHEIGFAAEGRVP